MSDNIDEVLGIPERIKRGQIARRNQAKLERGRKIAQSKPANQSRIKKRAYALARQIVRTRYAGKYGENYSELSPSQKINIDKAIADKQKLIKKLAMRLIPKVKRADHQRLQSFIAGKALDNLGAKEGHVQENHLLNAMFEEAFGQDDKLKDKDNNPKKNKKSYIEILNRFDPKITDSITRKSEKSGVCEEILGEVFARGLKSWTEESNMSPTQFAFARVNSFINMGKNYFEEDSDLINEKVITSNPGWGYHGYVAIRPGEDRDKKYRAMHKNIKNLLHSSGHLNDEKKPNVIVKHFLDSIHGRHIAYDSSDKNIVDRFNKFKTTYNPRMFSEETKPYTIEVVLSHKNGQAITRRITVPASSHEEAHNLAKMEAKKKYVADKIHDTRRIDEAMSEEEIADFVKKSTEKIEKYGHRMVHLTKRKGRDNITNGYVVGHDPKREDHVMVRANVSTGVRSKNDDLYRDVSVPEKHLTHDYTQSWYMKKKKLHEISQTKIDDYKTSAMMDKTLAKTTLAFDKNQPRSSFRDKENDRNRNILRKRERGEQLLKKRETNEEVTLQELSKKLLSKYTSHADGHVNDTLHPELSSNRDETVRKFVNRTVGIQRAKDKIEGNQFAKVSAAQKKSIKHREVKNKIIDEGREPSEALKKAQHNLVNLKKGIKTPTVRAKTWKQHMKEVEDFHKEKFKEHKTAYLHHKSEIKNTNDIEHDLKTGNLGIDKNDKEKQHGVALELDKQREHHYSKMHYHNSKMHYHNDFLDKPYQIKEGYEQNSESDPKKREIGTPELTKALKKDTPGQDIKEAILNKKTGDITGKDYSLIKGKNNRYVYKREDGTPEVERDTATQAYIAARKRQVKEEFDDGWYTHHEMYGKISKEDWKKGWRYNHLKPKKFYNTNSKTWHSTIKEETLNELSKKAILGYLKKSHNVDRKAAYEKGMSTGEYYGNKELDYPLNTIKKLTATQRKREKEQSLAYKKLAKEEVTTADREPVIVQAHKDQYGNTIRAKTVMRKKQKKIIDSGNVHDGDRGRT